MPKGMYKKMGMSKGMKKGMGMKMNKMGKMGGMGIPYDQTGMKMQKPMMNTMMVDGKIMNKGMSK